MKLGQPAAKKGDQVIGVDTHIVIVPSGTPTPLPHPFTGIIQGDVSADVMIMGQPAATAGSTADNSPVHIPTPPGTAFQTPPADKGTIQSGSTTVMINGKAAARHGDVAKTCNDPVDLPVANVVAVGTVFIGG